MGGSSSQPRTDPTMSLINAFLVEDLYTPEFSESLQENTCYWQEPNPQESPVEQVATSPTQNKKPTRNRQKRLIQSDDAPRQIAWTTKEEIALCKGWVAIFENSDHDSLKWKEIALLNFNTGCEGCSKRQKSSGSISFNTESGDASINLNTSVADEVFLALGWHLEEIHVIWAHLEKKRTRLRTYTKSLEDLCIQRMETASQA
ncbi:hypothetical protein Tco_1479622 [Tanacetum coccineum]